MGDLSPLAPDRFPDLPPIGGVRIAAAAAGLRKPGRLDVMLAALDPGTEIAGVFTRSATRSAAVLDCQAKIGADGLSGGPAAIIANSGNANAFTGSRGRDSVDEIVQSVSSALKVAPERVFTSSTGVIGEPLPHERVTAVVGDLGRALDGGGLADAARAIMTTDTFPKAAVERIEIGGKTATIAGIAKGSGMIAPDMATMLAYVFTDAALGRAELQPLLAECADRTFNSITVDSDTSTSDTVLLCATGASGASAAGNGGFAAALERVMLDLAQQIVRDGEGATKFVEIRVTGATSDADAKTHGLSIANSPLVKTAIAGEDPNWGRIVMAIGKSGAAADRDLLAIRIGDVLVAEKGQVSPSYDESLAAEHMKRQNVGISVDLGLGEGQATLWTCDLTHRYIEINADYRS